MLYVENTNEKINSLSASFLNFVQCGRLLETCTLIEFITKHSQSNKLCGKDGLKFLMLCILAYSWNKALIKTTKNK